MNDGNDSDDDGNGVQAAGNFAAVQAFVENEIIKDGKAVSMKILQSVYGLKDDRRYRHKLKKRLQNEYPNLIFVQPNGKYAEVVFSQDILTERLRPEFDPITNIRTVAEQLKSDILDYCSRLPEHSWPPTIETLLQEYGEPPESVKYFLQHLLTSVKHNVNARDKTSRLIESLTADFVFNVSDGKVITPKHYLLALGLHNITGQKQPVVVTNKLGHCISYDLSCEIETALSEASVKRSEETSILPIKPEAGEIILTVFWVDNFDVKVERQCGAGAVNTTHLMAFQEKNGKEVDYTTISLPRSGKRKFSHEENIAEQTFNISNSSEPPTLQQNLPASSNNFQQSSFNCSLFTWIYLRKQNSFDQQVPNFAGLQMKHRQLSHSSVQKTEETYLPPITSKVTEYKTIAKFMTYLKSLAAASNMPYVNITLDVGAAINAYKFLWSNQEQFHNIVIHLGDFHFMKENFQVNVFLYLNHEEKICVTK